MHSVCGIPFPCNRGEADVGHLAWEISQAFVTKWAWLVDHDLIHCSNFWRAERGQGPLMVPDMSGFVLDESV